VITRIDGVGDNIVFGARDYSMRVWLDPAQIQARGLTASDVIAALRAANIQVAAGSINQPLAGQQGRVREIRGLRSASGAAFMARWWQADAGRPHRVDGGA
jgi:multidrug efflux pump subunit AcrB